MTLKHLGDITGQGGHVGTGAICGKHNTKHICIESFVSK